MICHEQYHYVGSDLIHTVMAVITLYNGYERYPSASAVLPEGVVVECKNVASKSTRRVFTASTYKVTCASSAGSTAVGARDPLG